MHRAAPAVLLLVLIASVTRGQKTHIQFPEQFVVSTGTTLPFDTEPVAQSGAIYFDYPNGKLRIDSFWMANQRTLVVDVPRKRAYIQSNTECVTSKITGKLKRLAVPDAAVRDVDTFIVRGVKVAKFAVVDRTDEAELVEIDMYLRQNNFTVVGDDPKDVTTVSYWVPWRVTTERTDRKELAQTYGDGPNWRYFGERVSDEIVRADGGSQALATMTRDIPVTMDFYNFVPMVPDPSVFEVPPTCIEPPTETAEDDLDVFELQRMMTTLSFNNAEGRRLLDQQEEKRLAAKEGEL